MTDHAVLLGRGGFGFVRPARPRREKAGTAERGGTGVWPAATKIISKQGLAPWQTQQGKLLEAGCQYNLLHS